jgi:glycosyltransferase involved in cell wall biosynthesis
MSVHRSIPNATTPLTTAEAIEGAEPSPVTLLFALPGFHRFDRGAEVALLSVAEELARSGARVTVMGSGEPRPNVSYRFRRVAAVSRDRFERFPKFPPFRSETAWEDATFAANLMMHEKLEQYDATVTCSFPFTHWALRAKSPARTAHIFVTQNGDWPASSDEHEYRTFNCDGLICTNPDYFDRNRASWRSALIPNGIDTRRFRPGPRAREKFGLLKAKGCSTAFAPYPNWTIFILPLRGTGR